MFDTLRKMIGHLETMATQHISISQALDMLEDAAQTYDELIVVNVMRESFNELMMEDMWCQSLPLKRPML